MTESSRKLTIADYRPPEGFEWKEKAPELLIYPGNGFLNVGGVSYQAVEKQKYLDWDKVSGEVLVYESHNPIKYFRLGHYAGEKSGVMIVAGQIIRCRDNPFDRDSCKSQFLHFNATDHYPIRHFYEFSGIKEGYKYPD